MIIVVTWPVLRPVTPGAARLRRGRPAVLASAARAGLDVALISLGALALWELRRYSAAPRLSGGTLGIDPVLVVAPAVALAGLSLLPLRILPAAARLLDGLSGRGRRLAARPGQLAGQQAGRAGRKPGPARGPGRGHRHAGAGPAPELAAVPARPGGLRHRSRCPGRPGHAAPGQPRRDADAAPAASAPPWPPPRSTAGSTSWPWTPRRRPAPCCSARTCPACPRPPCGNGSPRASRARGSACPAGLPGCRSRPRMRPPRGGRLGALTASVSVQDSSGTVYSVPGGHAARRRPLPPADRRSVRPGAPASLPRRRRYPLRLLGVSLSYQLPQFPAPPYGSRAARRAAQRSEHRAAETPATLDIRGLAVSPAASGSFPAAFAGPARLRRVARRGVLHDPGRSEAGPGHPARHRLLAGRPGPGHAGAAARGRATSSRSRAAPCSR